MAQAPETLMTAGEQEDAVTPGGRMLVMLGVTEPVYPAVDATESVSVEVAPDFNKTIAGDAAIENVEIVKLAVAV